MQRDAGMRSRQQRSLHACTGPALARALCYSGLEHQPPAPRTLRMTWKTTAAKRSAGAGPRTFRQDHLARLTSHSPTVGASMQSRPTHWKTSMAMPSRLLPGDQGGRRDGGREWGMHCVHCTKLRTSRPATAWHCRAGSQPAKQAWYVPRASVGRRP